MSEPTDELESRKTLEDRLRHYRELYDAAPVALLTLDVHGVIEELNLTAVTMLGGARQRLLGTPLSRFIAEEDRTLFFEHLLICRGVLRQTTELTLIGANERRLPVALFTRSKWSVTSQKYPTVITDLPSLRRGAEPLRLAKAPRTEFFAQLSHGLRTPLTPVLAALSSPDLMRASPIEMQSTLSMIRANVEQEARLLDDMLDIPHGPHAREKTNPTPLSSLQAQQPLKILLVEDHADTSDVIARLLRQQGHDVVVAFNMHEAMTLVSDTFDVLISDVGLPDGSGLELMKALSRRTTTRGIALSGYATEDDVRKSREAGFEEHLIKPVSFQVLMNVLHKMAAGGE